MALASLLKFMAKGESLALFLAWLRLTFIVENVLNKHRDLKIENFSFLLRHKKREKLVAGVGLSLVCIQ
jgi:hypothetical protein